MHLVTHLVNCLIDGISFLRSMKCKVCHAVADKPAVLTCCQAMVGCDKCIEEWKKHSERCPNCRETHYQKYVLRGFDSVLEHINQWAKNKSLFSTFTLHFFLEIYAKHFYLIMENCSTMLGDHTWSPKKSPLLVQTDLRKSNSPIKREQAFQWRFLNFIIKFLCFE